MNIKLIQYKERLQRMLLMIEGQETIEDCFDFDKGYIKQKEREMISDFSAEFAALGQLMSEHIARNNARPLGTIVINETGKAQAV